MLDLGNLRIGVTLDDADAKRGLQDLKGNTEDFTGIAEKAFTVAAAAAAALGVALAGVTKSAVEAYASYEQLIGGIDVIFGDTAGEVEKYAKSAYKTMGVSANDYMKQVTGISASLLQSLGGDTKKAAKYANMAMQDMSDNASIMGSDIQSIQNAYQGFAKQNYMMLDNLRLGYGQGKSEMERLLADAEAISGVHYDISNYSDVIEAIHTIQTEYGYTGNVAREASKTIEGSVNMAKAAYSNWLVALADENADLEQSTQDLADSIELAVTNVAAAVKRVVKNLIEQIPQLIQELKDKIPNIVDEIFPPEQAQAIKDFIGLLEQLAPVITPVVAGLVAMGAALKIQGLITGVAAALRGLMMLFTANPILLVVAAVAALAVGFIELYNNSEEFRNAIDPALENLKTAFEGLQDAFERLKEALQPILDKFTNEILPALQPIAEFIANVFIVVLTAVTNILSVIVNALADFINWINETRAKLEELGAKFVEFRDNVVNAIVNLPQTISALLQTIITNVVTWVTQMINNARQAGSQFVNNIISFFTSLPGRIGAFLSSVISSVASFVSRFVNAARQAGSNFVNSLISAVSSLPGQFISIGSNIVSGMLSGITGAWDGLVSRVMGMLSGLPDAVKKFLGIASPSKLFAEIGAFTIEGFEVGFAGGVGDAIDTAVQAAKDISISFKPVAEDMTVGYRAYQSMNAPAASSSQTINYQYNFDGMTFNDLEQMRNVTIDELINLYHLYGRNAA